MSHFHVILQEIFHNLSIFQFSVSQIFSFSDSILGVPATPSGFPLYLCSLSPAPVPKSRPRTQIPSPFPHPLPKSSQRMPLQSLTQRRDNKIIILLLRIARSSSFAYFLYETTLQQLFQCTFNGRFANIRTKCGNIRFLYNTEFFLKYSFHSIRF